MCGVGVGGGGGGGGGDELGRDRVAVKLPLSTSEQKSQEEILSFKASPLPPSLPPSLLTVCLKLNKYFICESEWNMVKCLYLLFIHGDVIVTLCVQGYLIALSFLSKICKLGHFVFKTGSL